MKYIRVDGTTWPWPDNDDEEYGLPHRLRYRSDKVSPEDAKTAADIIEAYQALVLKSQRRRNLYAGAIKRAVEGGK